jgi:sugar/nucleoside kinase (ribokinase family)
MILGIGDCTLNHIAHVNSVPRPDEAKEIPRFSTQGSGAIANAAVALSRWNEETKFIGKVGPDYRGDKIIDTLRDEGIDVSEMIQKPGEVSQLDFTFVKQPEKTIHTFYTKGTVGSIGPEDFDNLAIDGEPDLLLCRGEYNIPRKPFRAAHRLTLLAEPLDSNALENSDTVVCSEQIASQYTGTGQLDRMCQRLIDEGPRNAVVTLGLEGAIGLSREMAEPIRVEGQHIEVVDTLGATDIFVAAVAYGLINDLAFEDLLQLANRAALQNSTDVGPRSYVPDIDDLWG